MDMKKIYQNPDCVEIVIKDELCFKTSNPDDVVTPGIGGGSGSRGADRFDEDED
ncbi:MAG: hypothetical protein J6M25_04560 [Prevotella sp.]|nr:hypothetical protein [Prevotella sp.]